MSDKQYQCTLCKEEFSVDQIKGIYPEDDSILCKNCFGHKPEEVVKPSSTEKVEEVDVCAV